MLVRMNIEIDRELLEEARQISSLRSYREIVRKALKEFVSRRKRAALLEVCRPGPWEGRFEEMKNNRLNRAPIQELS